MIELYFLITLGAIGYMMNTTYNTKYKQNGEKHKIRINKSNIPSVNNIYDSNFSRQCDVAMAKRVAKVYNASQDPVKTAVISKNFPYEKDEMMAKKIKTLSGEYVDEGSFLRDAQPFFGTRIRQNMDPHANATRLENFTGTSQDTPRPKKCEVSSFFEPSKDLSNINGMKSQDDFYLDRIVTSRIRNNETPFEKVYVGPGLNQGFESKPIGGFQQYDVQDLIMPKCVDQLRAANKPKETYEGRVLDGIKSKMRADMGKMDKNRPDTFYEQTEDNYLRTTGSRLKATEIPKFNVKETNRMDTSKEYVGTAMSANAKARTNDPNVRQTSKSQLGEYGIRNASLQQQGKGDKHDYGKSKIIVYANERDLTTTRVQQGNLTSLVKAIIAPVQDLFKTTKKDEFVDNPRHFGNVNPQLPDKPVVYDPNDVAKTTIKETTIHESINGNLRGTNKSIAYDPSDIARTTTKETTIHESVNGNLKGSEKAIVHDPNDIARTTTKETTIHESINGNLRGHSKITVHDPNDIARTTTKETTIHDSINGNLKGNSKITVYDPNDIARTTIKETLIHDEIGKGTVTGPKQLFVYDPDVVAKRTIRETVDRMDYELNLGGMISKPTLYDPDDHTRTTMKETLIDNNRDGNIDGMEGTGDYKTTNFDPRNTQKQFISDNDYYGGATRDKGEGYQTNEYTAKKTQKQFTSDHEYFGHAEAGRDKKAMSYEDMYNAYISSNQETLIKGRDPTKTGKKEYITSDCISITHKKQECDLVNGRITGNIDKINSSEYSKPEEGGITRMKKEYSQDDRLDPSILKAYLDNPYTKPLDSVA